MGALSGGTVYTRSNQSVSCDLNVMDQGSASGSGSSSPTGTPVAGPVSNASGTLTSSQNSSCQSSNMTSRASSVPDAALLQDMTVSEEETATQQQQEAAQICFDFTKGMCTRGDKCKYSHDIATIVHFNSKEKGICFDYLRSQCHRGLLCRFSHDLSNIAQQCQVYSSSAASAPAHKTRSGSICYDFVKGVCTRGSECRYSHDLTLIARMARGSNGAETDQGQQADVCFDFLRGRCTRGDTCKYSHNPAALHTPATPLHPVGLDPMMTSWPLTGINPQAAAAAAATAAAAAAIAAAGGVTPAGAGLNPFTSAAGLGGFNPFTRPGMLGLGADPFATAAAAASLAATSPGGPVGLLGGVVSPFGSTAGLNLMHQAPMTRHGSMDSLTSGTPTQTADAVQAAAAAAGGDPLTLLMAMQQQQHNLAAAAAAASAVAAAAACSGPAISPGLGGIRSEPMQTVSHTADMSRPPPKGPTRPDHNAGTHAGRRLSLHMPCGPLPSLPGAATGLPPPGALLPPINTPRRLSDLSLPSAGGGAATPVSTSSWHKSAATAGSSFGRAPETAHDAIGSRVSCDGGSGGGAGYMRTAAEGPNGHVGSASAGLPPLAGQQPPGQLGRAHSAPTPSCLQQQQQHTFSSTGSGTDQYSKPSDGIIQSSFNPLAAGLNHLKGRDASMLSHPSNVAASASSNIRCYPKQLSGDVAVVAHSGGLCSRASSGLMPDSMSVGHAATAAALPNWLATGASGTRSHFRTYDAVAGNGASPSSVAAETSDWESSPDAVAGSGDELDKARPYGDLLPRLQAIWSK